MQARRSVILNQPALIPVAGPGDRKPRSLDRDVTTVGRARGSDLCLEANEISTLHCVIYRTAEGYRVRDCNSRCGTRINGNSVKAGLLHDADIVNLGPFSFEFRVPPALFPGDGVRLDPVQISHWKESRRRLAQRALRLRKRLQSGSPREQEWAQKAHLLKEKIRCYDQRLRELEAAEEELADEHRKVAAETENHRQHVQTVEQQLADRLAQADQEIHERWQQFQRRCQAEEAAKPQDERSESWGSSAKVRDLEQQYQRRAEQLQREYQEFVTMKEQWVKDQSTSAAALDEQQAALTQKKAELVRMMGDLKKMQEELRKQAKPDVRALHDEVERLQRENAELRAHADDADARAIPDENEQLRAQVRLLQENADPAGLNDLQAEVELLREELENKEQALNELSQGAAGVEPLRAENELLKKQLEEKNRAAEDASRKTPKNENDLERYETELTELSRQLETDRVKLNKEVEILRERNKELDEAVREMEMEMSKERAELGRERMRLERVREEVKADAERLQREMAVRDSMAPLQRLRDELAGKQPPAGKTAKPLNDRLRGLRDQLADSSPSGS